MAKNHTYDALAVFILMFYSLAGSANVTDSVDSAAVINSGINDDSLVLDEADHTDVSEHTAAELAELQHTISQYTNQVLQLEIENGAYNNDLSEALTGLGLAYSAAGNHQEALDVYTRALHINRVNEGLQNINQLPILERVIQANTALGDYKSLADNYSYLLWIYGRNYDNGDPALVPVLQKIANWHLDAYEVTEPPDSVGHLVYATNLFTKALEIIELTEGPHSPELINPLYGIVNANFKMVEPFGFIQNIDFIVGSRASPLLPSDFNRLNVPLDSEVYSRNDFSALGYNQEHLSRILQDQKNAASLIQNSYRSGRNALERIVDIHVKNPDLPRLSHAYALTHLGDWYLRFYKRSVAQSSYEQAYQVLLQGGHDVVSDQGFFSYPRSLDTFKTPQILPDKYVQDATFSRDLSSQADSDEPQATDEESEQPRFVRVQFNVTEHGVVRNLDIIESNPADNIKFRRMARDRIMSTPFRPRLENGKPTMTESVKMLYRFE